MWGFFNGPRLTTQAVKYAIDDVGYRHIDGYAFSKLERLNTSAWAYGNEAEVGNALKQCKTPRSEIFVTVS
jgi:diketogulonate reductase-like aldo/keto reductase